MYALISGIPPPALNTGILMSRIESRFDGLSRTINTINIPASLARRTDFSTTYK